MFANWVNRILDAEPNVHLWVQLPRLFLKPVDIDGLDVKYNFDDSVNFPRVESPILLKKNDHIFNKAVMADKFDFLAPLTTSAQRS